MARKGLIWLFGRVVSGTVAFIAIRMAVLALVERFQLPPALIGSYIWLGLVLVFIMPGRWLYLPVSIVSSMSVLSVIGSGPNSFNAITTIVANGLVFVLITELMLYHLNVLRKSNRILEQAKQTAESATKKKDVFLAYMSHEIRNPLSGIIGMTDLLLEGTSGEKRKFLGMIRDSSQALQRIIEDLLDLSVMEADGVVLQPEVLYLREYLFDLCTLSGVDAKRLGIDFHGEINCADGYFLVDRVRFRQIVGNLLSNAFKFSDAGSRVLLQVSGGEKGDTAAKDSPLKIVVSDEGSGISLSDQEHIFDSFYRSDASKRGGAGLGLFIVKKMVEVFGGSISVESQPGKGSSFIVDLPLKRCEQSGTEKPVCSEIIDGAGKRILVAEDNVINASYMRIMLEKAGYLVDVAQDGVEALELYREHFHSIVLLDISMPQKGGDEVLAEMLQLAGKTGRSVFSVAVTGMVTEPECKMIRAAGFNEILFKPVDSGTLLSILAGRETVNG